MVGEVNLESCVVVTDYFAWNILMGVSMMWLG